MKMRWICMCYIFFMLNLLFLFVYFRRTKCFTKFSINYFL
jgi:hypothetical protein